MENSNRSGQIRYKSDAVSCQDAGLIRWRNDERVVHSLEEENNDDDGLVMIDNVVYNGRRALPRPPMELPVELPYDEIAACPEVPED
nr:hypothetical protein BaRGS_010794 [Batillaria attramentaria]